MVAITLATILLTAYIAGRLIWRDADAELELQRIMAGSLPAP